MHRIENFKAGGIDDDDDSDGNNGHVSNRFCIFFFIRFCNFSLSLSYSHSLTRYQRDDVNSVLENDDSCIRCKISQNRSEVLRPRLFSGFLSVFVSLSVGQLYFCYASASPVRFPRRFYVIVHLHILCVSV